MEVNTYRGNVRGALSDAYKHCLAPVAFEYSFATSSVGQNVYKLE